MKKHLTIKQTNRILSLIIVFLVLLIAVYFVKGRVQAAQMKNEQRVASQQAENDEIDRMLENSDYYLNQEARGENDYCDPEENVYVVVP